MGLSPSILHILVIGPTNSGKTHLLDLFSNTSGYTLAPTIGVHEAVCSYEGHTLRFIEFGGSMDWAAMLRTRREQFDCIYLIMRSPNDIIQGGNGLIQICGLLPSVPVAIVWNSESETRLLQYPRHRKVCQVVLSEEKEWVSSVYRLFKWTIDAAKVR
jgi:hypothetical protein